MKQTSRYQRIAVIGANGRLGTALTEQFSEHCDVIHIGREQLDLYSHASIRSYLESLDFDLLFLPAAQTNVDRCETYQEEAFAINASAPLEIARICSEKGAKMVHFSTDFVFDGLKADPYLEGDQPNPISVYGASKYEGEKNVLDVSPDHLVARLSWVFGEGRPGFPEWIVDKACAESEVSLPGEKLGCPSYSADIARWLDRLLFGEIDRASASGVFHLCNAEVCTWQEWGQGCVTMAKEEGLPIKAEQIGSTTMDTIPAFVAKRPVNSAMMTTKLTQLTGVKPRSWMEALKEHITSTQHFRDLVLS